MNQRRWRKVAWAAGLLLGLAGVARAAGPVDVPASNEPRVPVAECLKATGLVASEGTGEPWQRVAPGERVFSRDLLMALPGLRAELQPRPNSVRLSLWGNLPQLSASPVLESAVILHDSRAFDLDLTLVRGRVVLSNARKKGPVRVWLRAQGGVTLTLAEPGDRVAIEMYGRWPRGVPFSLKPRPGVVPVQAWTLYVLKGRLDIKAKGYEWSLSAPPGRAYFHGDSVSGPDEGGPKRRTSLPAWADPKVPAPPEAKTIAAVVKAYRSAILADKEPEEVARDLLARADKDKDRSRAAMTRQLVVYAQAALDNVDWVAQTLANPLHPEMRQAAVVALRHWIGSGPGRDEELYERLTGELEYTKAEAATILQLLHSPFAANQPETFEALIAYLGHARPAVRELAAWHLYRLAPAGRDIAYDPTAPAAERTKAVARWRKLIPSGELPPPPPTE
jgi:hypothetical protein